MMSIIEELSTLYKNAAEGRYGLTAVRQRDHALQAGLLAESHNESVRALLQYSRPQAKSASA